MSKKSFSFNKFAAVFCIVSFFAVVGCAAVGAGALNVAVGLNVVGVVMVCVMFFSF